MDPEQLVRNVNRLKYPPTVYAQGWIYGVWYCSTSFQKARWYGAYPATFVKRVRAMFPDQRFLHLCCGGCKIENAVNVDLNPKAESDLCADVERLPFTNGSFGMVLIDPPYSELDAQRYKVPRLINTRKTMREAQRVLRSGGYLLWLDEKYPSYRRGDWQLVGLIGIVTGFERRARVLSIFQKPIPPVISQQSLFAAE